MQFNGYTLSRQAEMAALGLRVTPKPAMAISEGAKTLSRGKSPTGGPSPLAMDAASIYALPKFPDGTYPADTVAMDSCVNSQMPVSNWAMSALFHEGQGFFGFPYLAELNQRVEYRHACEIWAEHCVRKWIKLVGGPDEKRTEIMAEFERLEVRDRVYNWLLHGEQFGRGHIFLDFGDADDDVELRAPLVVSEKKISPKRPLKGLNNVEPMWIAPGAYRTNNPLHKDFYKPSTWYVWGKTVDKSHLLTNIPHPVSDMLKAAYAFGGQALPQLMKPYVDNWLRARQSVSDMMNSYSLLNLKTDMSSIMGGGNGQSLYARVDIANQTRDNRGMWVTDKDSEELENIAVPLSGLSDLQAQSQEQLASSARIPLSIYLQITPTGLNATSDGETRNFYADVHSKQESDALPGLQIIFQIVQLSLYGKIDPEIKLEFEPLWEMNDKDKADIRKADAEADIGYVTAGIIDPEEVRERLANDETSLYHGVDLSDPAPGFGNDGIDQEPGEGGPANDDEE